MGFRNAIIIIPPDPSAREIRIPFSWNSASPITVATLLVGEILEKSEVTITTVFDGGNPVVTFGTVAAPTLVFGVNDINEKLLGTYRNDQNYSTIVPGGEQLMLTITPSGGTTQGAGELFIRLVR